MALLCYLGDGKHVNTKVTIGIRMLLILITSVYSVSFCGLATDHDSYVIRYNSSQGLGLDNFYANLVLMSVSGKGFEPGFGLLNLLGNYLGLGELGYFFILSVFINSVVIWFIYKYPMPVLSYMFLASMQFFLIENNLLRQTLAMCIILLFLNNLREKKWIVYGIGVLLASSFHTSALMFLVFLPICFINDKSYNLILKISIAVWLLSFMVSLGLINVNLFSFLAETDYYSSYAGQGNDVGTSTSLQRALMFDIVSIWAFLVTFRFDIVFSLIVVFSSVVMNFSFSNPNVARLYFYFAVVDYVYISYILSSNTYPPNSSKSFVNVGRVFFVVYCVFRLVSTYIYGDDVLDMPVTYSWSQFFK